MKIAYLLIILLSLSFRDKTKAEESIKTYNDIYYYEFQKGDTPWSVLKFNYGFVNKTVIENFLAENNIDNPNKIKINFKAVLRKRFIEPAKLSVLLRQQTESKYLKKINNLNSDKLILKKQIELEKEVSALSIAATDKLAAELKEKNSLMSSAIILSLIVIIISVLVIKKILKSEKNSSLKAKQALSEIDILTKRINEEHEKNISSDIEYSARIKKTAEENENLKEKIRNLAEDKNKKEEYFKKIKSELTILDIFRRRKPGHLDIVKIGKEYYPRIVASWTLNALLLNKRFLKSTDVYFSELRMACGKCGEIVGN